MKRLAMVLALVAVGACQKAEQKPAQAPAADTSHAMMQMADTSKKMMMADTSKKMAPAAPAAKPAMKPAAKKKKKQP